jgi:hypothetical protein
MKNLFIGIYCALTFGAQAQTAFTRSYPVQPGQHLNFKFDYPAVRISTWDKNEVSVTATVNINDHEYDQNFELQQENKEGTLVISDSIKDLNNLPHRYTVVHNDKKTVYRTRQEYLEAQKGSGIKPSYEGTDIDILLEIKVPVHCTTAIISTYGIVELTDFNAPITVDAPYGGIDATINTAHTGKLQATTRYCEIYSNLDMKLTAQSHYDFFNSITAEPGNGPAYVFTSDYGKIYLRKP